MISPLSGEGSVSHSSIVCQTIQHKLRDGAVAAIEAVIPLPQIAVEMLLRHAVMGAVKPCFQIRKHDVDDRQMLTSSLTGSHNGVVLITSVLEAVVALPAISDDPGFGPHVSAHKISERGDLGMASHFRAEAAAIESQLRALGA